jgi:class 3 adenylate cyclase
VGASSPIPRTNAAACLLHDAASPGRDACRAWASANCALHPSTKQEAGDYFGRTVNLAARIADYARPGEVVVSQDVVDVVDAIPVSFVEIGPVELQGVSGALRLHTTRSDT